MESSRKKDTPSEVTIRHAKNGGYIVRHSFDNMGRGESYRPSEEHAFTSHQELMAHVHTHTALGKNEGASEGAGTPNLKGKLAAEGTHKPAGIGRAMTGKAPGPRSHGAGVD